MVSQIWRPTGWVAGDPVKLILLVHGAGSSGVDWYDYTYMHPVLDGARAAGYTLMGVQTTLAGREWGNPTSVADYVTAYNALDATENITGTVMLAASMGGLPAGTLTANQSIPTLRGVIAKYPVLSLASMYADNPGYQGEINSAYGASSGQGAIVAASLNCDPYLRTTSLFSGIPWHITHSAGDTVVNKAHNVTAFAAKVASVTTVTVLDTSGDHGDPTNWVWSDISGWLSSAFDVAEGYGTTASAGYGAASTYTPPATGLTVAPESNAWEQVDTSIFVRTTADESTVTATVVSDGGLLRFRGADADLFSASLDGTTWASAIDVPAGVETVHLRVTPAAPGTTLTAEVGVPV